MRVLPDGINRGYHGSGNFRVMTLNGKKVKNLKGLIAGIEASKEKFLVIGDRWGTVIGLDRKKAIKATPGILKTYRIPFDRLRQPPLNAAEDRICGVIDRLTYC